MIRELIIRSLGPQSFHIGKVLSYLDKAIMATRLIPSLSASYSSFALSFDRLVLYLRALGVSSTVLWSLTSSHAPSKPCASALARILNCLAVLWSVHQRVLVGPFQEYMNTLADFKNRLLQDYNPWDQITLVQSAIFRFRTLARSSNISAVSYTVEMCVGEGGRVKCSHHCFKYACIRDHLSKGHCRFSEGCDGHLSN